ncbi:Uncharacterised protein [Candidatus Gugararchaeum adminiculabundum]|nr:Uncharacterised protein [Candidatus Gugararchaeum adminiculabundum]
MAARDSNVKIIRLPTDGAFFRKKGQPVEFRVPWKVLFGELDSNKNALFQEKVRNLIVSKENIIPISPHQAADYAAVARETSSLDAAKKAEGDKAETAFANAKPAESDYGALAVYQKIDWMVRQIKVFLIDRNNTKKEHIKTINQNETDDETYLKNVKTGENSFGKIKNWMKAIFTFAAPGAAVAAWLKDPKLVQEIVEAVPKLKIVAPMLPVLIPFALAIAAWELLTLGEGVVGIAIKKVRLSAQRRREKEDRKVERDAIKCKASAFYWTAKYLATQDKLKDSMKETLPEAEFVLENYGPLNWDRFVALQADAYARGEIGPYFVITSENKDIAGVDWNGWQKFLVWARVLKQPRKIRVNYTPPLAHTDVIVIQPAPIVVGQPVN